MHKIILVCLVVGAAASFKGNFHGGHRGPHFLKGVSKEVAEKFHKVLKDENLTKAQRHSEIEKLVKELPEENQKLFKEHEEKHKEHQEKAHKKVEEAIAKLSPAAQELAKKVHAVHENQELTRKQEHEEVKKLFKEASDEVRKELKAVFPGHHKHNGKHAKKHHAKHAEGETPAPSA